MKPLLVLPNFEAADGTDFLQFDPTEAAEIVKPYISGVVAATEWRSLTRPIYKRIIRSAIGRACWGSRNPSFTRTEPQVSERYSQKWIDTGLAGRHPVGVDTPVTWGDRRLVVNSIGLRRLYIARLMRLIEQTRPGRVLDVGCGNGEKLLLLACRFPEVSFHGVELTPGGVAASRAVQQCEQLPAGLVAMSPEPLRDLAAHRRVSFQQGSASHLPFNDGSIDLVYTSLAIEQMQSIKDAVLAEIARVSGRHASFFEAFHEFNRGPVQRLYLYGENYFRGSLADLHRVGFRQVASFAGLPQKVWMNAAHVVAAK